MIASKLYLSTHDSTAYIVTQLSKDNKSGRLPKTYHVVLDESYPCTEQEMSPWKGYGMLLWNIGSKMGYFLAPFAVIHE
jgi:hypothetical protein